MNEEYTTQSIYEGAFLLAKGCELAGKSGSGGKISIFFKDFEKSKKEALNFYNGGSIKAKLYSDCYRTIKDYIFTK